MLILLEQLIFQNRSRKMKKFIIVSIIAIVSVTASCSEDKYPDLGVGYKLDSDGKYTLAIVDSQNTIMVESHMLYYAFDSTFIIASQRPWNVPDVPGIKEMTYNKRREAFEKSTFCQYWIINKKEKSEYMGYTGEENSMLAKYSNVYGPFSKEEYLQKREEMGVPKELKLKEKQQSSKW